MYSRTDPQISILIMPLGAEADCRQLMRPDLPAAFDRMRLSAARRCTIAMDGMAYLHALRGLEEGADNFALDKDSM